MCASGIKLVNGNNNADNNSYNDDDYCSLGMCCSFS